jgi:transposase-like protein
VGETSITAPDRWAYLYRAIGRGGNLPDTMFSGHRDMAVA